MSKLLVLAVVAALWPVGVSQAASPPPLSAYGALPQVEDVALSPSGARVGLIFVKGEDRYAVGLAVDGAPMFKLNAGSAKVRGLGWAGDDHLLISATTTVDLTPYWGDALGDYRDENFSVGNIDVDARKLSVIFQKGHFVPAVFGQSDVRIVDGKPVGFFGGYEYQTSASGHPFVDHGYLTLYRVDLESGQARTAAVGGEYSDSSWVPGVDGRVVAHSEFTSRTGQWRLFADDKAQRLLLETNSPLESIAVAGLGRTPGAVLVDDQRSKPERYLEYPFAGGDPTSLFEGEDIQQFYHDPRTGLLLGARASGGKVILFDPVMAARWKGAQKAFPGYQVRLNSFTPDMSRMIVFTDGGDDSGAYWFVDIATGKVSQIGSAYPSITSEMVGPTRMVAYKAADGLAMEGVLTLPPGREAKNLPVVVMPHGGPLVEGDRISFDWMAQAFASRGYAVFQPNYRGTEGYGWDFEAAAWGQYGRKMQTDISDGLAELVRQGLVDPKRACIVGASYGGYAALAGVTLQQGLYRCAVSVAGVSDLKGMINRMEDWEGGRGNPEVRYYDRLLGAKSPDDPIVREVSPAAHADRADAPVLLIHGKDDTRVPFAQSQEMYSALKAAGKPVEFIELKDEDHFLSRQATRTQMIEAAVAFVTKHNPAE
jgi:dipeptidyl aminopeptidase/acylaminoacyl peptidase